jgi:biofilm PGA synthesis N-glycosyltransferase PgaC
VRLAVIVSFLNEERLLPILLESIARQDRAPDELLLVDDGSSDHSGRIADGYAAANANARALRRPQRSSEVDRLATAAELRSFLWGVDQLELEPDVVVKLDADLRLRPDHFSTVLEAFRDDPSLGVCGSYLAVDTGGKLVREHQPAFHVRGPNKFYRRECFADISPLKPILGWDTFDEITARGRGWNAYSVELPGGDSVHLRPTGLHDGRLRAMRRWGECAWGYGATPLTVLAGMVVRARRRPFGLAAINYGVGYARAALTKAQRADPEILAMSRGEQRRRFRAAGLRTRRQ